MEIAIVVWVVLSFVVAAAARARGRSAIGYFLGSFFFSPLLAGFVLILFPAVARDDPSRIGGDLERNIQRARRNEG